MWGVYLRTWGEEGAGSLIFWGLFSTNMGQKWDRVGVEAGACIGDYRGFR